MFQKAKFVTVAVLAVLLAGVAQAQGLKKINLTQAVASFAFLPISYAKAAGFYADEGIDLTQIATRGGGPDMTALLSGDVQFNAAAGTYQISALKAGRSIINVYNFYSKNLINITLSKNAVKRIGVSPTAPFSERVRALRGLTLGMTRPGSLTHKQLNYLIKSGGMDPKNPDHVKIVAIGGPPNLLAALERGQIDGFAISVPINRIAVSRGKAVIWIDNASGQDPAITPFMMESLLTTAKYAEANPDVVRAMVKATRRAVKEIQAKSAQEILKVVRGEFTKFKPSVMLLGIEAIKPALNMDGRVTVDMARKTLLLDGRTGVEPEALFGTFTDKYMR